MNFKQWKNRKVIKEILGDFHIDKMFEDQVISVLEKRNPSNERIKVLAYWVLYSIEDNYVKRFDKLLSFPKNSSSSLEVHILRYGEEEGTKRFNDKAQKCAQTEQNMIKRYGEEGKKKWEDYKNKISYSNSEDGYITKYGKKEGKKKFKEQSIRNAGNLTLERKQELLGDEIGLEEFNKMKVTLRERHSLENYIRLYGEAEGTIKYLKLCETRAYKNSLAYYIEKYGEEEGTTKIKKVKNNGVYFNNYSKISLELFDNLSNYSELYGEKEISIKLNKDEQLEFNRWVIKPDFTYENKIIEFHGDIFHANPDIFSPDDCPNPFEKEITASEIWNKDNIRTNILLARNYNIKIVWESEFKKNKQKIINECITFLDEG